MESDIFGKASVYGQLSLIWVVDLSAIVDGTTSEESLEVQRSGNEGFAQFTGFDCATCKYDL